MRRVILLILIFTFLAVSGCANNAAEITQKHIVLEVSNNKTVSQPASFESSNVGVKMSDLIAYGITIDDMVY
jgi:histidine ammonia-lyase